MIKLLNRYSGCRRRYFNYTYFVTLNDIRDDNESRVGKDLEGSNLDLFHCTVSACCLRDLRKPQNTPLRMSINTAVPLIGFIANGSHSASFSSVLGLFHIPSADFLTNISRDFA